MDTESVAPSPADAPAAPGRRHQIRRWLAGDARTAEEVRDAVFLFEGDSTAKEGRFWLLLILATAIATAGVIGDSTATVIGAMIVAPLAIPIQGVAVAISLGDGPALLRSAWFTLAAVAVVIGLAAFLAWAVIPVLGPLSDNSQVTSRSNPTLVDLAAASATGIAGAFAVTRRDIGDILPGVAIAISLVPPLCVVGVAATEGEWASSIGALLLFATNVLAMIVLGALVAGIVTGRRPGRGPTARAFSRRRVYTVIGVSGTVVVLALGAATAQTVLLSQWQGASTDVAEQWARENGETFLRADIQGDTLVIAVEGSGSASDDRELVARLSGEVPEGTPVIVNRIPGTRYEAGQVK